MRIEPTFREHLENFDLEAFDDSEDIIYGVDADMRLAYFNNRWVTLALENGADPSFFAEWGLGSPVDKAFGSDLAAYYLDKFERARESGEAWEHEYLCPAPTVLRRYQMRILPLSPSGWLVIHTKIRERPREGDGESVGFIDAYRDDDDIFHQCSHCGRFRKSNAETQWDWVPELFKDTPERTSHGLCQTCFDYYYSQTG
ncbi:MAG: hypothetical protein ACQEVA_15910 [Myxococcota bacterium]